MFVYIGGQVTFTAVTNIRGGDDTFRDDPITIIQQTSRYTNMNNAALESRNKYC